MALLSRAPSARPLRTATGYARVVAAIAADANAETTVDLACRLAAEKGATVHLLTVVEVPELLPIDAHMLAEEEELHALLARCRALADGYGVHVETETRRARVAGDAVVDAAREMGADLVVLGYSSLARKGPGANRLGRTAAQVLRAAPCRVSLVRPPR